MYEAFFQLQQRPFAAAPRVDRYFPAAAIEHARQTLSRAIERAEGPGLLVGAAGTGKTLVCHLLAEQFHDQFRVAMLACARLCTRRALLQSLLFELGLPYRNMEEGELRLALIDHLEPSESCPHGMLLLVDEAHVLPLRLLDEIRMITNLVRDGVSRVRLVLAGGSLLEERFASPKLESFNQRVAARCYLDSLSRDETFEFVRAELRAAGGNPDRIFTDDALRAVYQATDGIPRLVNQVCDHALMLASLGGQKQIGAAGVEEAWADLQQLPTPWQSGEAATPQPGVTEYEAAAADTVQSDSTQSGIVEFGQLDDAPEPAAHAPLPSAAELRLDQIEEQVAAARDDEDFQPAGSIRPEVELVFHGPHDPFAHPFDEEEVVIDRYATLEAGAMRRRPRVTSEEGRRLAAAFSSAALNDPPPNLSIVAESGRSETGQRAASASQRAVRQDGPQFDPASDPVMPDVAPPHRPDAAVLEDDSDLIVVEDGQPNSTAAAGRARRQEYRQLFARLRRG